ncbi:protein of unknown function [Petrocella atlantisensis]|uniref:Uncharacterized protein n=1 Tax=Petrocella atlantisensis TaxID=2173034 RepID=A0A3P7S134_9FIRM|nr:protein of unknown function [Petrocella atlantisensis]
MNLVNLSFDPLTMFGSLERIGGFYGYNSYLQIKNRLYKEIRRLDC